MLCNLILLLAALAPSQQFDELMGSKTKHWSYVEREEDRLFLQMCKEAYEKSVNEVQPRRLSVKIPKTIHFIWLGPKPFPPESVENVRTWIANHPDWTVKFWTDRDRPTPCKGMEKILVKDFPFTKLERCFVSSQNYGEKSDILRYEILYQEGGVYADHDANSLQSFLPLHASYDFYCGLETPHEPFVGQSVTCGNGVIGARAGHPAVKRVIELIDKHWEALGKKYRGRDSYSRTEVVMQRTYIALTDALKEGALNQQGNCDIVLPAAYFFSKSGIPSLYSKHFYATAWADSKLKKSESEKLLQKKLDKIQQKSKNIHWFALGLLLMAGLLIFTPFWRKKCPKEERS